MTTTTPTVQSYTVFSEALKRVHALREEIGRLKEEGNLLDQLVSFLVLQLSEEAVSTPIQALHTRVQQDRKSVV